MDGTILHFVETLMGSPWVYAALFAFAALDGFFPLVPSESLVITAGVFAASGEPILPLVILAAAAGAFAGDHVAYLVGRTAGGRLAERRPRGYPQAQGVRLGRPDPGRPRRAHRRSSAATSPAPAPRSP